MRNITVAVTDGHLLPARTWPAKHMTSASRIVAKTVRQIAEQTPNGAPPAFFNPGCETVGPAESTTWGPQFHSSTVSQAHPPAYPIVATIEAPYRLYAEKPL